MIYNLNGAYIDLGKLEFVSELEEFDIHPINDDPIEYYFVYQINGNRISSSYNEDKNPVIIQRDYLINAWKEYKNQK